MPPLPTDGPLQIPNQGKLISSLVLLLMLFPAVAFCGETLRIAIVSDLNGSYGSTRYGASIDHAVERLQALKPDLVISTGDMVAGQRKPHLKRNEVEVMWRAFHEHLSDPLATAGIPLAVTPGNHDGSTYHGFELERLIYAEQWVPRKPALQFVDEDHYPFYYAFIVKNVLFISLDATTVGHLSPDQMDWLREILDRYGPNHSQRVIFSHLPLWPFAKGRETEYIGDPELERLLQHAGVDLYLSGHHHAFYPGHKGGIDYISQSCLGAGPRRLIGSGTKTPRSFTMIELTDGDTLITAFQEPAFDTPIDWSTLPPSIRSPVAELIRVDLVDKVANWLKTESPGR